MLLCLADAVGRVEVAHPTRVAVDGPPAAGKTTLADELAVVLRAGGRDVIRATIEGFLFPKAQRYRRAAVLAERLLSREPRRRSAQPLLLDPLGPHGDRRIRLAIYDRTTDTALSAPVTTGAAGAVLVFDGVFQLRPEFINGWDLRIFLSTSFERRWTPITARRR
jgi:uridine kinase